MPRYGTLPHTDDMATVVIGKVAVDDGSGNTITSFGGTGTQFAEDAAHTSGDLGTMALAVRKDTVGALAGTDGDYIPLIVDSTGRLWIASNQFPTTIGQKAKASSFSVTLASDDVLATSSAVVAHTAPAATTMLVAGGQYRATAPTFADLEQGSILLDLNGRLQVAQPATTLFTASPTVSSSPAYASGDVMGTLMTFANATRFTAGGGLIQSVTINSKSLQTAQIDVIFFNANPASTTFTDNAVVAINAADFDKVLGVAHVADWANLGTPSLGQAQNCAIPFALASGTTLYAAMVSRGTPTLASSSDFTVAVRILPD